VACGGPTWRGARRAGAKPARPARGEAAHAQAVKEPTKLLARLEEFIGYIENNQCFIVNYGVRYRHGKPVTSSFVESAVNQVVSKRFVKRQQMAWRPAHAHGLLQVRTAVLNEQLRSCFERWYPALAGNDHARHIAA
jgi:hypothetical protein